MKFAALFAYASSVMAAANAASATSGSSSYAENEDSSRSRGRKMIRGSGPKFTPPSFQDIYATTAKADKPAAAVPANKDKTKTISSSGNSGGDEELEEDIQSLETLYHEMGQPSFWHALEVMQYRVSLTRPLMPHKVTEPGYVSSIPPIPEDEKQAFHEEYLDRTKRSWRTDEMTLEEIAKCQFDRLDWVQKNPDILVNQLRESNFTDDEIEGIFSATMPNGFNSRDDWSAFVKDLNTRGAECLEKQTDLRNIQFIYGGSSASGYSTNPYKGKCSIPTWMTSKESDMDIVIVADNVALTVGKTGLEKYLTFQTFIDRWSATTRFIIGTHKKGASEQKTAAAGNYNYNDDEIKVGVKTYNDDDNYPVPDVELASQRKLGVDAYEGHVRYYDILGPCFAEFWNEWEDKTTLPIQFALQDNTHRGPGWQFVIASGEEEGEE